MKSEDMSKEMWSLANIITGFSVAQPLAVAIAMGNELKKFQHMPTDKKTIIVVIAVVFAAIYCFAVHRCRVLAKTVEKERDPVWREVNIGRMICIGLFTGVFIFALYAPELFPEDKAFSPDKAMGTNVIAVIKNPN